MLIKAYESYCVSEEEVRDQMNVNFYGPLRTVKACLPGMRAKGSGNIVLISSGAGYVSEKGHCCPIKS